MICMGSVPSAAISSSLVVWSGAVALLICLLGAVTVTVITDLHSQSSEFMYIHHETGH